MAGIGAGTLAIFVTPFFICRGDHQLQTATLVFVIASAIAYLILDIRFGSRFVPAALRTIVVAIVFFIPPGVAVPGLLSSLDASRRKQAREEMEAIGEAVEAFRIDRGRFPTPGELVPSVPRHDPWRHPYAVEIRSDGWTVRSYGVCGTPGAKTSYRFEEDLVLRDGAWIGGNEP